VHQRRKPGGGGCMGSVEEKLKFEGGRVKVGR